MINYIAIHNTGGTLNDPFLSTQNLLWQELNEIHHERWVREGYNAFYSIMLSNASIKYWGGYNVFIEKDGSYRQFRAIGEETGAQKGHNFDTISICLAGNFTLWNGVPVDSPTEAQKKQLTIFLEAIQDGKTADLLVVKPDTTISVPIANILPHRRLQVGGSTACFGDALPDDWGQKLLVPYLIRKLGILQKLLALYLSLRNSVGRLGVMKGWNNCFENPQ